MSGPYDQYPPQGQYGPPQGQYNQGYPPAPQYGHPSHSPAPYGQGQGQYPPQQPSHSPYNQQSPYGQPPPQPQYGEHQGGNYGPPAQGGFQHGQQPPYPDYNNHSQGQHGYPHDPHRQAAGGAEQYPGAAPGQQFPQQGAYNQAPFPGDPNNPNMGPQDANGERGIMGAIGGATAGYYGGKKMGGHTILGALSGAFAGHKLEEYAKHGKQGHGHGHNKW